MAWTYTNSDPTASALNEVRFLIGDTTSTAAWTLQDGEIQYAIAKYPSNLLLAAALCAESIVAKLKSQAQSESIGDLSISYNSTLLTSYQQTAYSLRQRANLAGVKPYVGGVSLAEKNSVYADTDRVGTAATIDGMSRTSTTNDTTDD